MIDFLKFWAYLWLILIRVFHEIIEEVSESYFGNRLADDIRKSDLPDIDDAVSDCDDDFKADFKSAFPSNASADDFLSTILSPSSQEILLLDQTLQPIPDDMEIVDNDFVMVTDDKENKS
jgi:hypothetical protein